MSGEVVAAAAWAALLLVMWGGRSRWPVTGRGAPRPTPRRWRAGRSQRMANADAAQEACELLAAELGAGRPTGVALGIAADQWPVLRPAAQAHDLGADVGHALREAATTPGAECLTRVAAAWQVSHHTGQGLARALARVAASLRAQRRLRRVVESELASARATARVVSLLPVAGLLMGSGAGGDPVRFLLTTPVGLACLGAGLVLQASGLIWIELIAERATRP